MVGIDGGRWGAESVAREDSLGVGCEAHIVDKYGVQQGAVSVGVNSDVCGVLLVERWSEVGKRERLIGLACLIGTTDALCDALAIDGTKGADIEVGVARVDDELDVGCVGRESVLDSDIELSANAL